MYQKKRDALDSFSKTNNILVAAKRIRIQVGNS